MSLDDVPVRPPLYTRVLRLRHLRVGGFAGFLLFECMVAAGVLLALAELVSWWAVPILPAVVAVMVKVNDLAAGGLRGAADPAYPRDDEDDSYPPPHLPGASFGGAPFAGTSVPNGASAFAGGSASGTSAPGGGAAIGRAAVAGPSAPSALSSPSARSAPSGPSASDGVGSRGFAASHGGRPSADAPVPAPPGVPSRAEAGEGEQVPVTYTRRVSAAQGVRRGRGEPDEEPRRPVGMIRISLPPRDGVRRRRAEIGAGEASVPTGQGYADRVTDGAGEPAARDAVPARAVPARAVPARAVPAPEVAARDGSATGVAPVDHEGGSVPGDTSSWEPGDRRPRDWPNDQNGDGRRPNGYPTTDTARIRNEAARGGFNQGRFA